ncbi:hypothetical protein NQZ68_038400 [Dissostichus eleginoides]|nr:hypothetical protein NQZ68_038400 [Dissostichus eleginoides]
MESSNKSNKSQIMSLSKFNKSHVKTNKSQVQQVMSQIKSNKSQIKTNKQTNVCVVHTGMFARVRERDAFMSIQSHEEHFRTQMVPL